MPKKKFPVENKPSAKSVTEFLQQSNAIENEFSDEALEDAQKAWDYLMEQYSITVVEILEVHRILMQRLRPDIAGKLRDRDVWIGGQHKKFVDKSTLTYQLLNALAVLWMSFGLNNGDKAEMAKDAHVMFEGVHPFEDGNGRTGRILYNWHRFQLGLSIHVIHTGEEQKEYYRWF